MSEMREPTPGGTDPVSTPPGTTAGATGGPAVDYGSAAYGYAGTSSPLLRLGGALGIAACVVGLLVFVTACAGFGKAVVLSIIPVGLSIPALALTLIGAVKDKHLISEDTHVLQALFASLVGLIGGLLEMAAWLGWPLFHR
jgi:hypothetical protein